MKSHLALVGVAVVVCLAGCATTAEDAASFSTTTALQGAYDDCVNPVSPDSSYELVDDGHSLIGDGIKSDGFTDLACVFVRIDTPQSIVAAMDSTTALMGRQHEERDNFTYEWSYHPDNGMDIIITED